ncbi:MAG TPA: hypothetical protein VFT78_08605 [Hanamia sp.]|nr:hypothetical protein [Hanamia sp.]
MKSQSFLILLFICSFAINSTTSFAQTGIDSSLAEKITVSGFCLCKTKLQDLQHLDSNIRLAFIENAYKPSEIAFVSVYKGDDAIAVAGKEAKNGAIYITTKAFARNSYWNYFTSKSLDYKNTVPDLQTESKVIYILNGKILQSNVEATLFQINNTNFLTLQVINRNQLKKDYHISGKSIGVVITTK